VSLIGAWALISFGLVTLGRGTIMSPLMVSRRAPRSAPSCDTPTFLRNEQSDRMNGSSKRRRTPGDFRDFAMRTTGVRPCSSAIALRRLSRPLGLHPGNPAPPRTSWSLPGDWVLFRLTQLLYIRYWLSGEHHIFLSHFDDQSGIDESRA
jgi:hypothetical protein